MFIIFAILIIALWISSITIGNINFRNIDLNNTKIHTSATKTYSDILWVENPNLIEPVTEWNYVIDGDSSDVATSFSPNQANMKVIGESFEKQVLLNNDTKSNWIAFNKTDLVVVPQRYNGTAYNPTYGVDDEGCWASHYWEEEDDFGQPKNTPRMHWKTNVSLGIDMTDYIITEVSFEAIINASVRWDIDTPGDEYARATNVDLDQYEQYDYAQFYVEISTIELDASNTNTYRIAFNQTRYLGNELLDLTDIEGNIERFGDQAIKDALNNVLTIDPEHDDFSVILGIYMYCEDNQRGTDQDHWENLRFKTLNFTFSYEKRVNQNTEVLLSQDLRVINGTNVKITGANLNFKYKIDKNWTTASSNSELRIYVNDRKYELTKNLLDYIYSPSFQEARSGGYDIKSILLPYENFTLSIRLRLGDNFGLKENITVSITDVYFYVSYTETFTDIIPEPWLFTGLFIIAAIAAVTTVAYLIAYQTYLKYPVPVRKVRKYRKTLQDEKNPNVTIIGRERSFRRMINNETSKTAKFLSGTPVDDKLVQKKLLEKE